MLQQHVLIFGMQGSGKTTIAKKLEIERGYKSINVKDIINVVTSSDYCAPEKIYKMASSGEILPERYIVPAFKKLVFSLVNFPQLAFDGYPRSPRQIEHFTHLMNSNAQEYVCLYLQVDRETATKRIILRRSTLQRPEDQTDELITKRTNQFLSEKERSLRLLNKNCKVYILDGSRSEGEVWNQVRGVLV
ncbi:MAG: nucleoside monophosphate kinase [Candidatus Thiodiazotropha endolucinida]|nr:nucleoside monophosphate kinase [Candidatus Thiodiazotropha endolucinida]